MERFISWDIKYEPQSNQYILLNWKLYYKNIRIFGKMGFFIIIESSRLDDPTSMKTLVYFIITYPFGFEVQAKWSDWKWSIFGVLFFPTNV